MRKTFLSLISIAMTVVTVVAFCIAPAFAQLRVPPTHVASLAAQSNDDSVTVQETETVTVTTQSTIPVTPIQHVIPTQTQQVLPAQVAPQAQAASPTIMPTHPQMAVVPQEVQTHPQMQMAMTPQVQMMAPGMTSGAIVVPVTVPQYMTYTPQPMTMMVNRPAQLVIPQYPVPMQQPMYDPMAMQMMQQQMMMQQMMMQQQMMTPPRPPQQPIPVKMILPDGSTVSIKHYVPGNFFKNVFRAVTP